MINWGYNYSPYVWPMAASAAFMFALAIHGWRHRASPGAIAFAVGSTLAGMWAAGNVIELLAADQDVAFWWFRFQLMLSTPSAVAGLCFVLQYAGLGRMLTPTTLTLLIAPSILSVPAYLLGDARLLWDQVQYVDGRFVRVLGPMGVVWNLYGLAVLAATVAVVLALFLRSPLYRKPAALMILGHSAIVGVQVIEMLWPAPVAPHSLMILSIDFAFAMYAIAFFRYRLLDVVPVARDSAVEQMADPMVVLDAGHRIADLNLAAQQLLGVPRARAMGMDATQALAAVPGLDALIDCHAPMEGEVALGEGSSRRWYRASTSPIDDGRGFRLGCLVVLHETTQLRLAQERLLQHERTVAALQERERVARELHDGVGQVLGYVSLQVEATRKLLEDGMADAADIQLARLAGVARDAHADVRGFILDLRAAPSGQRPLVATLDRYLDGFSHNYGLLTELVVSPALEAAALDPEAQTQVFRIIQEAITNARKHGCARSVQVSLEAEDGLARIVIQDDGSGFDPTGPARADDGRFGLQFMSERAAELGGWMEVDSAQGQGTRVVVRVPMDLQRHAGGGNESIAG